YVPTRAVAEEVVQDAWLGVVRGIDRFEGRSSLKTWLFQILVNRARSTGRRERRTDPLPDVTAASVGRSRADGHWSDEVEQRLDAVGLAGVVRDAIDALPPGQRRVVLLRDVEGVSSIDACALLGLTEGNQRVLLHRGRSRIRGMLEDEPFVLHRRWSA